MEAPYPHIHGVVDVDRVQLWAGEVPVSPAHMQRAHGRPFTLPYTPPNSVTTMISEHLFFY